MRAALDDPAVVEHQHLVGVANRAQAVGHDEAGATGEQPCQRLLDAGFGQRCRRCWWLRRGSRSADRPAWPGRSRPVAAGPSDKLPPRSPTWVCKPSGKLRIADRGNRAAATAAMTSASVASGRPKRMLSSTVPLNKKVLLQDDADAAGAATRR